MPNNALLSVMGCALVLSAAGVDYGMGQLDIAKPHRLPVESFPSSVGSWQAGPVLPVDPDVQAELKTAKIVERVYSNRSGQKVDMLLLTATEDEDMHSPQACFPNQGWVLSNIKDTQVAGDTVTSMSGELDGAQQEKVVYWVTGYYPPAPPQNALLRRGAALRAHLLGNRNTMSLFVRLIGSDTPSGSRALSDFTDAIRPPLQVLKENGAIQTRKDAPRRVF